MSKIVTKLSVGLNIKLVVLTVVVVVVVELWKLLNIKLAHLTTPYLFE